MAAKSACLGYGESKVLGSNFFCKVCFEVKRGELRHAYWCLEETLAKAPASKKLGPVEQLVKKPHCGCGRKASIVMADRHSLSGLLYSVCVPCYTDRYPTYPIKYKSMSDAELKARSYLVKIRHARTRILNGHFSTGARFVWRKAPTKAEATRMARVDTLIADTTEGWIAAELGARHAVTTVETDLGKAVVTKYRHCGLCNNTFSVGGALTPWLREYSKVCLNQKHREARASGLPRATAAVLSLPACKACWIRVCLQNAMAYKKVVEVQFSREGGVRSRKEIAKEARSLTVVDVAISYRRPGEEIILREEDRVEWPLMVPGTYYGNFRTLAGRRILGLALTCHSCNGTSNTCVCQPCDSEVCRGTLRARCRSCQQCTGHEHCECRMCFFCRTMSMYACETHGRCPSCCTTCANNLGNFRGISLAIAKGRFSSTPAWPRFLGFEIETHNQPKVKGRELRQLLINLGWGVGTDASVPSGKEFRSCPVKGDDVEKQIKDVITLFKEAGLETNASCGLHIHVDAGDLTSRQLARTFVAWASIERRVFDVLAPARKGNRYCKLLFDDSWSQVDGKELLEDATTVVEEGGANLTNITFRRVRAPAQGPAEPLIGFEEWCRQELNRQQEARVRTHGVPWVIPPSISGPIVSLEYIIGGGMASRNYNAYVAGHTGQQPHYTASPGQDRYHSLNFQAYRKQKTLEFRLFEPRLDVEYILACARVGTATLEFGRYGRFTDLPKFEAKTKSKSTRLTYEKLLVWFEDHVAKVAEGKAPTPVDVFKAGVAE